MGQASKADGAAAARCARHNHTMQAMLDIRATRERARAVAIVKVVEE